ncbi:MAG: hypothetical protein ACRDY0_04235 [Acidimicrobiales bacterium]
MTAVTGVARPRPREMRWRRPLGPAVLAVVVFAVDLACPSGMTADSERAVSVAVSLVHFHSIGLDHLRPLPTGGFALSFVGGHAYPFFPWAVSLFAVPWVAGYDVLHRLGIGGGSLALVRSGHDWALQVVSVSAVVAATTVVVYFTSLRLLGLSPPARRRRWAYGVALAFAFATPAWSTASRSMWQHGPSMLCLAAAILFALRAQDGGDARGSRGRGRRRAHPASGPVPGRGGGDRRARRNWAAMGAALATSFAMRPTDAIVVAVVFGWMAIARRRHLPAALAGALPAAAVILAVNLVSYHAVLSPYYSGGQGFDLSPTTAVALAGNLVSPARGLLVFCPLVVLSALGVWLRRRRGELGSFWKALAVIPVLHWLVISTFKHWWGGDSFGPRLFTDLMPIFVVLALPAMEAMADRAASRRARVAGGAGVAGEAGVAGGGRWAGRDGAGRALAAFGLVAVIWSFGVNAQGAVLRSAWCWNNEPTDVDKVPAKLWQWSDPQFARGLRRLVWGPDRSTELIRDGVDLYGCPTEAVRP